MEYNKLIFYFGIILVITGFFLISLGIGNFSASPSNLQNQREYPKEDNKNSGEYEKKLYSKVSYSGIIMVGPIPIVFGNSPYLIIIALLTLILMIIWIYLSIRF